jgi:hypothetical protein
MTDDRFQTVHTDEDGTELAVSPSNHFGDTDVLRLRSYEDDGPNAVAAYIPRHVADAIRTALAAGPDRPVVALPKDGRLADITALMAACDAQDRSGNPAGLSPAFVRELLGLPAPCGAVAGMGDFVAARCTRPQHSADTPHVDAERRLEWREIQDSFNLRGWDGADYDAKPRDIGDSLADVVEHWDEIGAYVRNYSTGAVGPAIAPTPEQVAQMTAALAPLAKMVTDAARAMGIRSEDAPKPYPAWSGVADRIVSELERLGAGFELTEHECSELLVRNNVIIPATPDDWTVVMRERAVRATERDFPARDFAKGAES